MSRSVDTTQHEKLNVAQHESLEIAKTDNGHVSVIAIPRSPVVDWAPLADRSPPAPGRYLVTEAFDVHDEGVATRAVNVMYWTGEYWLSGGYRQLVSWAIAPEPDEGSGTVAA